MLRTGREGVPSRPHTLDVLPMQKERIHMTVKRDPGLTTLITTLWATLGVFVLYPIARLLFVAFFDNGHFTLSNLIKILSNWYDRQAVFNSLYLALLVAVAGVILGFIFAFAVTRTSLPKPLKWLLGAVTVLPLVSPPFTSSIALTFALGPNGILIKSLGLPNLQIFGVWGTWLSETLTYFPIAFLTMSAILAAIDPNLEDAGLSLGSSKLRTFRTITLPLSTPGLANSFLLLFASSLSDFATPLVLAGHSFPVLPTQAYLQITGLHDLKSGAGLSFILLIPAFAVYLLQRYWVGKRSYVTVTGKAGARTQIKGIGTIPEAGIWAICSVVSVFILFLYSIILYSSFIKVWGVDFHLTLNNYKYVLTMGQKAIIDTLLIAAVATPLGGLVALAVGYLSSRRKFASRKILEFVSLLNYALPGTVIGIAYVISFNTGPIVLTGTMAIIVAAYAFRYNATGIRSTIASLQQIDSSLEEASLSLGASSTATIRKVTVPLIIPAVINGMKFLFIRAMTAISATIFLVSIHWTLLTTRILECITELQFTQASAFSIVLIVMVFLVSGFISLCFRLAYPHYSR